MMTRLCGLFNFHTKLIKIPMEMAFPVLRLESRLESEFLEPHLQFTFPTLRTYHTLIKYRLKKT